MAFYLTPVEEKNKVLPPLLLFFLGWWGGPSSKGGGRSVGGAYGGSMARGAQMNQILEKGSGDGNGDGRVPRKQTI